MLGGVCMCVFCFVCVLFLVCVAGGQGTTFVGGFHGHWERGCRQKGAGGGEGEGGSFREGGAGV